jgi:hypothetical protein
MNKTEPTKTEAPTPRRYHSPADKVRILRLVSAILMEISET